MKKGVRGLSRHLFYLLVITSLSLYGVCLAEDVELADDLKDLGSIGVKVTTSHSEESFLAKQLTEEKVYLIVEDRLHLARIEILEGESFHKKLGEPYLSVVVITQPIEKEKREYDVFGKLLLDKERLHMYGVNVSLFETANLTRNSKKTLVDAWSRSIMGWSRTTDEIEKVIKEIVEKFCRQYISTNTK
jgi:hypothetical protein